MVLLLSGTSIHCPGLLGHLEKARTAPQASDDAEEPPRQRNLTPLERANPKYREQHAALGYYCSSKVKQPVNPADEEKGVSYSAINL